MVAAPWHFSDCPTCSMWWPVNCCPLLAAEGISILLVRLTAWFFGIKFKLAGLKWKQSPLHGRVNFWESHRKNTWYVFQLEAYVNGTDMFSSWRHMSMVLIGFPVGGICQWYWYVFQLEAYVNGTSVDMLARFLLLNTSLSAIQQNLCNTSVHSIITGELVPKILIHSEVTSWGWFQWGFSHSQYCSM